jgi:formylglycine-generating enzyme required for sulfatase activity
MTYEHEAMHAETLLYMLIQSAATRPPTCLATPQWDVLAKRWGIEAASNTNEVLSIPAGQVEVGHDDAEDEDEQYTSPDAWAGHEFGWDPENPRISVHVPAFKVDALPISNGDYLDFAGKTGLVLTKDSAPASWVQKDGEWRVRTLYGPVGFDVAGRWPVQASKNELEAYARWKGGRLPSEVELRAFWAHEDGARPAGERANVGFKNWHPVP